MREHALGSDVGSGRDVAGGKTEKTGFAAELVPAHTHRTMYFVRTDLRVKVDRSALEGPHESHAVGSRRHRARCRAEQTTCASELRVLGVDEVGSEIERRGERSDSRHQIAVAREDVGGDEALERIDDTGRVAVHRVVVDEASELWTGAQSKI